MYRFRLRLSLLLIVISINLHAQKSLNEIRGDKYYSYFSFNKAIENYSKADKLSVDGQRNLAESYKKIGDYPKAEEQYGLLVGNNELSIPEDYFNYADALKHLGKYADSHLWLEKYANSRPTEIRSKLYKENKSKFGGLFENTLAFKVTPLGLNTEHQEFAPTYYKNKLVYTSSLNGVKAIKRVYNWNNKPFLDLYLADIENGQVKSSTTFHNRLNKAMHEGAACFAKDGKLMAFTRNNYEGKSNSGEINLQIFFSEFVDGQWKNLTSFPLNNSEYSVGHPSLSSDGSTMFFASNMPGGIGGVDLYKIEKDSLGNWGKPENLGEKINTEGNEMFPFLEVNSNVLLFSSDGHLGLGGLDLFYVKNGNAYSKVVNFGTPINTQYDDFSMIIDSSMKSGYFASNRVGGKGDDDLYSVDILAPLKLGKQISGVVKDRNDNLLPGATVTLHDGSGNELNKVIANENGRYSFPLEDDQDYSLTVKQEKFFERKVALDTRHEQGRTIERDVLLEKMKEMYIYFVVYDNGSKQPLSGVNVRIVDNSTGKSEDIITDNTGDVHRSLRNKLNQKISFNISLEKEGYLSKTVTYNKLLSKNGQYNVHEELDLSMDKVQIGADLAKLIEVKPIYFNLGKFDIRKDAAIELDKIVKVMNENPNMVVELGSHTDCRSSADFNLKLSDRRAKSSAEYIKKRIINAERISGKGYGESKLINDCNCEGAVKSTCSEAQHQENRRTEFIIIKM